VLTNLLLLLTSAVGCEGCVIDMRDRSRHLSPIMHGRQLGRAMLRCVVKVVAKRSGLIQRRKYSRGGIKRIGRRSAVAAHSGRHVEMSVANLRSNSDELLSGEPKAIEVYSNTF
jgi:hypothetical protein